jgi:transposase
MAGKLPMGQKELLRGKVLEQVKTGPLTLKEAALRLKISYRQAKRLYRAYREKGDAALILGYTGRRSNNRTAPEVKERALEAYRNGTPDSGRPRKPLVSDAAEKLAEAEGIRVCGETLRQWLLAASLWERKRRSKPYRSRRERKACFGELVQALTALTMTAAITTSLRGGGGHAV